MFGQRRRRWPNIKPMSGQFLVFAGMLRSNPKHSGGRDPSNYNDMVTVTMVTDTTDGFCRAGTTRAGALG